MLSDMLAMNREEYDPSLPRLRHQLGSATSNTHRAVCQAAQLYNPK
jgi:hypothetical protein